MKHWLAFAFMISLFSCSSDPIEIPVCIDQEIAVFAQTACPGSGDLTLWSFDGQDVFCFNEGTCYADANAFIYDANCNLICILGGFSGNTICDGIDWESNAVYLDVIYVY